jgi:hypothetical protein
MGSRTLYVVTWADHNGARHEWTILAERQGEVWAWAVKHGADYRGEIKIRPFGT